MTAVTGIFIHVSMRLLSPNIELVDDEAVIQRELFTSSNVDGVVLQ